uniref:WRKY domain-containing protein n=1 Tax=Manihot esculenta TaxID=3983 RepID=A0A2C9VUB0_MANES
MSQIKTARINVTKIFTRRGTGLEGPVDDGYNWRKYGQKDILGANFPRGYYRCTHRHSQGCLATKQVQRSDQDPTIFEVTYRGRHTCFQTSRFAIASTSLINAKSKLDKEGCQLEEQEQKSKLLKELSFNFTEELKSQEWNTEDDIFHLFSFPETTIGSGDEENDIFKESMLENNILGSLSTAFISPATSDSSYLAMSPCHMNNLGIDHNVRTPESNSASTSGTNSPIGDWDLLDNVDFDTNFPLDNPELLA